METILQEMREEIERLKVEISITPRVFPMHNAMKDVTLVAGIKGWTGDGRCRTVYEFLRK